MIMDAIKKLFAQKLMDIKAIKLQPNEPFTWASGWKSPIYTDNRKTLGLSGGALVRQTGTLPPHPAVFP